MFSKILAANNGSENAFKALDFAADLAARYEAELHVVVVEELVPAFGVIDPVHQAKAFEDRRLAQVRKRIDAAAALEQVKAHTHIYVGHPVRTIVQFSKDNGFNLVVIGATAHPALLEYLVGTPTDRIVHGAECPVLVVR